ncbi:hypothetical protein [Nostoc sp. CALU 546]|uniref:hypothetical protein n=1 Tax=Nostoc sp. CALU 546 TaxID=1867241 RepID=UPI003B66F4A5
MALSISNVFDPGFYRAANQDLAGFNDAQALSHFQSYGLNEGRSFSPLINLNFYRASSSDLANFNNSELLNHLVNHGVAEGRSFSPNVSLNYYRANNSDLTSFNNEQLFNHLKDSGVSEGRSFSLFFSTISYNKNYNSDLSSLNNSQLLNHFEINGINEGRQFSPFFDFNYYRANNQDLTNLTNSQLLQHFQINGINEGRKSSPSFDAGYYKANNPDLAFLQGVNLVEHFNFRGLFEGRKAANDYAGNTFSTFRQLPIRSNYTRVLENVGSSDPFDYYRFDLNKTSTLRIFNYSYSRSVLEQVIDSSGNVLSSRNTAVLNSDNNIGPIPVKDLRLSPGTYYVRIQPTAGNTNYFLSLSDGTNNSNNSGNAAILNKLDMELFLLNLAIETQQIGLSNLLDISRNMSNLV